MHLTKQPSGAVMISWHFYFRVHTQSGPREITSRYVRSRMVAAKSEQSIDHIHALEGVTLHTR